MKLEDIDREKKIRAKARVRQVLYPINKIANITNRKFYKEHPNYRLNDDRVQRQWDKYGINAEKRVMKKYNLSYD